MQQVLVTGLGQVSALGQGCEALGEGLLAGRSGLDRIGCYDPSWFATQVGGEVRGLTFDAYYPPTEQRHLDRQTLLTVVAADEAVAQAGLDLDQRPERRAVMLGTGMGPSVSIEDAFGQAAGGVRKPRPMSIPKMMFNAAAGHLSIRYQCQGPSQMIVTACSASAQAIGQALWLLRNGLAEVCLAGGCEPFPSYTLLAAWDSLRVMSCDNEPPSRACRPFAPDRCGFVMGEAAAVLVLETADHARGRGATPLCELAGVGYSSDAAHITRPSQAGFERAIGNCLADAGLAPEQVGYINAHGTGTEVNDPLEAAAIRAVFGDHARRLPVSSIKAACGHTIGAAGALEAVATVLGLTRGYAPPTVNLTEVDPACELDHVRGEAREVRFGAALSHSFAFGGHNAVLAFRRC